MSEDRIKHLMGLETSGLYHKDFLLTWDKNDREIEAVLLTADILKDLRGKGVSPRIFDSGLAVSIFRDKSTRTRFSFAGAANMLGLAVQELDETKSQVAHGETVRETANMISFLTEVIGIRDDMYLGEGNSYMREVAEALEQGFHEGVLPTRTTLVNLQCDIDHPTQSMADLLHLIHHFGGVQNLKGKKIAMSWAYSPSYGKPLSVPQGILGLMTRFGMDVTLAHPEGYTLLPETLDLAENNSGKSGGRFTVTQSMEEAFTEADAVYPKSWAPFAVMEERTRLLKQQDMKALEDLEKTCLQQNARYMSWECTAEKMKRTKNGQALYMHCLPADITGVSCDQGEVARNVFEQYRLPTYMQAGNKPYVIAAMMLLSKLEKPGKALKELRERSNGVYARARF